MNVPNEKHSARIMSLEFMRVIMTGVVFLSHMEFLSYYSYGDAYTRFFHNATIGVDYFFLLSGFGLMASHKPCANEYDACGVGIRYGVRKIKSLYSPYIISMVVMIPYVLRISISDSGVFSATLKTGIKFLICGTMLQSLSGVLKFSHAFNGAGWFVSAIFIIYCLCPKLLEISLRFCKSKRKAIISSVAVAIIAASIRCILFIVENNSPLDDVSYGSPLVRVFYVLYGMCIYQIYRFSSKHRNSERNNTIIEILVIMLATTWFLVRNSMEESLCKFSIYTLDLVIGGSLLYSLASECGKLSKMFSRLKVAKLGKDMMYIYLYHYPIRVYIDLFFESRRYIWGEFTGMVEMILILLLTIGAYKIHKCIMNSCRVRSMK